MGSKKQTKQAKTAKTQTSRRNSAWRVNSEGSATNLTKTQERAVLMGFWGNPYK